MRSCSPAPHRPTAHLLEHARQRFVRDGGLALPERGDVDATVLVGLGVMLTTPWMSARAPASRGSFVPPDPFRGPPMLAVIPFSMILPGDVTAGADAGVAVAPGRALEEAADPCAIAESLPVDIVLTVAVGIDPRRRTGGRAGRPCRYSPGAGPACRIPPAPAGSCRLADHAAAPRVHAAGRS